MSRRPPLRSPRLLLLTALSLAMLQWTAPGAATVRQRLQAAEADGRFVRQLEEFGPVATPAEAQAAWDAALDQMRTTGGVLVVPAAMLPRLKTGSLQETVRIPEAPAETKSWRHGPGITVVSAQPEQTVVQVPPLNGLLIQRQLRLPQGNSLPHWGTHPMLTLDSKLVYGSTSYLDWIQEPVEKGLDRRFYVPSVRGLHPGQFLNLHGGPGYGGGVTRAVVKSTGFDPEKKLHYFVADTSLSHTAGAIAQNKSNTGLIHMLQTSHNDNQTYDVKVIRNQYAHGDTYIYYCDFNYMSNIHSSAGDENGNCYAAFVRSMENAFRGQVAGVDWDKSELKFASGSNVETLGDSRPLINLNPARHITQGKVRIVPGDPHPAPRDPATCIYQGQNYHTALVSDRITGSVVRKFGGLIRGDRDCPWTDEIVGRFFAVANPEEKTPAGSYRWYQITGLKQNADGTKDLEIQRYWWGAKSAGSPTLYRYDNYTWDDHDRPLDYIIAPGAYVNDVGRAVAGGERGGQQILGLAGSSDQGTKFDFAAGDPVEQAIGPDPFKPHVFRSWMWENVPGRYPSAVFDIANYGAASRSAVLSVRGGPSNLDDVAARHEQRPAWDDVITIDSAAIVGLNFKADFADAAILFDQPHHEQAMKWRYGREEPAADARPQAPKLAVLTVDRQSGAFKLQGGGLQTGGAVSGVAGISGDDRPARNLRGKNVPVAAGQTRIRVEFAAPESDGDYAVFVEQSWLTQRAISEKGPAGFTVTFADGAPAESTLDWMIVR